MAVPDDTINTNDNLQWDRTSETVDLGRHLQPLVDEDRVGYTVILDNLGDLRVIA